MSAVTTLLPMKKLLLLIIAAFGLCSSVRAAITKFEGTGLSVTVSDNKVELYKFVSDDPAGIPEPQIVVSALGYRFATDEELKAWTSKFGADKIKDGTDQVLVRVQGRPAVQAMIEEFRRRRAMVVPQQPAVAKP